MSHYNTGSAYGTVHNSKGSRMALAGGVAIVATGLGAFYMNLHRRQAKKERKEEAAPGSALSTWTNRLAQAANIDDQPKENTSTLKASRIEPRAVKLTSPVREHNNGHSVISKIVAPIFNDDGDGMPVQTQPARKSISQPAPQRDRGDGRPYTKSPDCGWWTKH